MQACRRWMNERKPGREWEAYTVQWVHMFFMDEYIKHLA
jgi:hypothetical protein